MGKFVHKILAKNEIPLILEKASPFGGNVAQATLNSKMISPMKDIKLTPDGCTMTVKLFEQIPLDHDRHISINLNYRNIYFHVEPNSFTYDGDLFILNLPSEARALAKRDSERYVMPFNQIVPVDIYRIERRGTNGNLVASIIDVSENGLGLLIADSEEDAITDNDHVWIRSVHGIELKSPIFGRIVYTRRRIYKDNCADTKVGISLDSAIPSDIFQSLKEMCKLILTA